MCSSLINTPNKIEDEDTEDKDSSVTDNIRESVQQQNIDDASKVNKEKETVNQLSIKEQERELQEKFEKMNEDVPIVKDPDTNFANPDSSNDELSNMLTTLGLDMPTTPKVDMPTIPKVDINQTECPPGIGG